MRVEVYGCDAGEFWNPSQSWPIVTILVTYLYEVDVNTSMLIMQESDQG